MRRSRKPFRAVSSDEGSNPSPSASTSRNPRISRGFGLFGGASLRLPVAQLTTAKNRSALAPTGAKLAQACAKGLAPRLGAKRRTSTACGLLSEKVTNKVPRRGGSRNGIFECASRSRLRRGCGSTCRSGASEHPSAVVALDTRRTRRGVRPSPPAPVLSLASLTRRVSPAKGSSRGRAPPQAAPLAPKKPGMFAPKGEKQLHKAIQAQDAQAIKRVGVEHGTSACRPTAWLV
jgi:hypothetical protein